MIVKDGKFYDNGVEVPLEHGNKEQIKILNHIQEFINEGHYPEDVEEVRKVTITVKCVCGKRFRFDDLELEEDGPMDLLANNTTRCWHCQLKYKLACDSNGDLIVKMVAKGDTKTNG